MLPCVEKGVTCTPEYWLMKFRAVRLWQVVYKVIAKGREGRLLFSFAWHSAVVPVTAGWVWQLRRSRRVALVSLLPHSQQTLCFSNFCTSSTCLTFSMKITLKPH